MTKVLARPSNEIYIIIWLRLYLYVLSVQSLSPPKPAGLDPPNFCRHTPNWLRNTDRQKKIEKKISDFFFEIFFCQHFYGHFFHEIAKRGVA
jgi:hypothetical protein